MTPDSRCPRATGIIAGLQGHWPDMGPRERDASMVVMRYLLDHPQKRPAPVVPDPLPEAIYPRM